MRATDITADTAQRSYTIAENSMWARRGMPWMVRKYGHGVCTTAHGEPAYFATEDAAHAHGAKWLAEGKA